MAIVRQSLHRWWMALATIVGLMGATVDASTCETMGQGRSAVAIGVTGGCPGALSDDAQVPEKGRLVTADRLTVPAAAQTCSRPDTGPDVCRSRPLVAPASRTRHPVPKSRSVQAATAVPDVSDSLVRVVWPERRSTLGSRKRPTACSAIAGAGDPNDDETSGDPDEDDDNETSKFLNGGDDTDVPIIACFQEKVPYLSAPQCALVTWTEPPSSPFLTSQRLRC
jgi:hypothetical protein